MWTFAINTLRDPCLWGHPAAAYFFFLVFLWICKIETGLPPTKKAGKLWCVPESPKCVNTRHEERNSYGALA